MRCLIAILVATLSNFCFAKTCYEGICLTTNYSKTTRPFLNEINNITIDFLNIKTLDIDDIKCTFDLFVYMNIKWKDTRIETSLDINNSAALNSALADQLWKPDLFIFNQKLFKGVILLNDQHPGSVWINNNKDLIIMIICGNKIDQNYFKSFSSL